VDPVARDGAATAADTPEAPDSLARAYPEHMAVPSGDRFAAVSALVRSVFVELSGVDLSTPTSDSTFLQMGFDSLFLTQAAGALQKRFATKITLRTLVEDAPTFDLLVNHIVAASDRTPTSAVSVPSRPQPRRGRDADGHEAWFVPDPDRPGKYLQVLGDDGEAVGDG
jgi:acyl carrier protein